MELTNQEIIMMIDEYLEEPNSIDPKWRCALCKIRKLLVGESA